jgi:COP9 signalosome complex subunit 7
MDVDDAASGKLASFLALAKSARGLAAASVIAEATAAPGLFAFGELLDMPHIQEVRARVPIA